MYAELEHLQLDDNIFSDKCQDKIERLTDRISYKEQLLFKISQVYANSEHIGINSNMFKNYEDCGKYLLIEPLNAKIIKANFCRQRLCPVCNYIKSTINWHKIKDCVKFINEKYSCKYIFMTLTVKNCSEENLKNTIDDILQAFKRLTNRRTYKASIMGCIRGLEITFNKKENTYHPHIHMLCAVPDDYFTANNKNYITIEKLRQWWTQSANLDYFVQVDIRSCEQTDNAIAEVAKYAIKMSSLIDNENEFLSVVAISNVYNVTYNRRLIASLGVFKDAMKELKIDGFDEISDYNEVESATAVQCVWYNDKFNFKMR